MTKEITTLTGYTLAVVFIVIFIASLYFWVKGVQQAIKTYSLANQDKKHLFYLNPLLMFNSKYYTDQGNYHRKLMIKYSSLFLTSVALGFVTIKLAFVYG